MTTNKTATINASTTPVAVPIVELTPEQVAANKLATAVAEKAEAETKRTATMRRSRFTTILCQLRRHAEAFRINTELVAGGSKAVPCAKIVLLGAGEEVANNATNALMSMGEYAAYRLEGKTQDEVMSSEDLTFFACIAHYGGSVAIKTATVQEVRANDARSKANNFNRFSKLFSDTTAKLFANK